MEKINNLLDMNNDILNLIGSHVKKDNLEREIEQLKEESKQKLFNLIDEDIKMLKREGKKLGKNMSIKLQRSCIEFGINLFSKKHNIILTEKEKSEYYEEYLTLKKLNLKKK